MIHGLLQTLSAEMLRALNKFPSSFRSSYLQLKLPTEGESSRQGSPGLRLGSLVDLCTPALLCPLSTLSPGRYLSQFLVTVTLSKSTRAAFALPSFLRTLQDCLHQGALPRCSWSTVPERS